MRTVIVDDDESNRERVRWTLASAGHDCHQFPSADSAAAALSEPAYPVDLVVTDVQMPGELDGVDLASMLALIRPRLPVVVMSASRDELDRTVTRGLAVPTLKKPFRADELLTAVATAIGTGGSARSSRGRGMTDTGPRAALADPRPVLATMFREAAVSGHPHVGTEHVALAALDGDGGFVALASQSGLDPAGLRPALLASCHEPASRREPGLTYRAASIVAVAAQLAIFDGTPEVGPRHLVAALLGAPEVTAWAGLTAAGLDHSRALAASRPTAADSTSLNRLRPS